MPERVREHKDFCGRNQVLVPAAGAELRTSVSITEWNRASWLVARLFSSRPCPASTERSRLRAHGNHTDTPAQCGYHSRSPIDRWSRFVFIRWWDYPGVATLHPTELLFTNSQL